MGLFNEFCDDDLCIQLKVGDLFLARFKPGDKVDISEGIYVGWEGAVVIKNGKFVCAITDFYTKWGTPININLKD